MIDPHLLFSLSGPIAMLGWLALIFAPFIPRVGNVLSGLVIPTLFSTAYAALVMAFWADAPGGFDSLDQVMLLFTEPYIALAGWLHYLAFDLFVGAWIVRSARKEGISHWLLLPILIATFLFGPVGFLAFVALRQVMRLRFKPLPEG